LRFARSILLVQHQLRQSIRPYQRLRYWSDVPFRHGPTDVAKYCATPSPENPAHSLRKDNPNSLQEELVRHLNEDAKMSCFDFGLQFLDTEKMTCWGKRRDAGFWIENATIEWNETQAPFHTVARLTLRPSSQLSAEESEAGYFDVTANATPDSSPLGSINRARWPAEMASRRARMPTDSHGGPRIPSGKRTIKGDEGLSALRLLRSAAIAGGVALILSACVPTPQYDALENDYNRLNQRLSSEIATQQVHISRF
jgi:hypothetical protein